MNISKNAYGAVFALVLLSNCGKDDEPVKPELEQELITKMEVVFTPTPPKKRGEVTLKVVDKDGYEGSGEAIIEGGTLAANTTYNVTLKLWDESKKPREDVTEEIEEEDEAHQFFFVISKDLNLSHKYNDKDGNGMPVGLKNTFTTGGASKGELTVTLIHEPTKKSAKSDEASKKNAGGDTDIEAVFPIIIE